MSVHSRNSVKSLSSFLFGRELLDYLKTNAPLTAYNEDLFAKMEELFNDDLKQCGKIFHHSSMKNPDQPNLNNIRSMLHRAVKRILKVKELDQKVINIIDDMVFQLTELDLKARKNYFGNYIYANKIKTYGKVIGGGFTRTDAIYENNIITLKYLYHFDILVPAPIYTKEFSDLKASEANEPTKDDIIRPDGLAQTTVKSFDNIEIIFDLNSLTSNYSLPPIKDYSISPDCVLLPDYDYIKFFEQVRQMNYKGKEQIKALFD